jgi:hypothetical protein
MDRSTIRSGEIMRNLCRIAFAAAAAAVSLAAATAFAAQQRSFVASDGLDTNPCTRAAPCRSFGTAIGQTLAGGEVVVIDSAGYGPVAITGPISLIAPPGIYAGITVSSGVGINVAAGGSDVVVLQGLSINNIGTGTAGIVAASGLRVLIDRCSISGFVGGGAGISLTTALFTDLDVTDTLIRDNSTGVQLSGPQFLSQVTLSRVRLVSNGTGVDASGGSLFLRLIDSTITGGSGDAIHVNPAAGKTVRYDVQRSEIIGNNIALNAAPFNAGSVVLGSIVDTLVSENGSFGLYANNAGATSTLYVSNCIIRYNGTGLRAQQPGSTIVFRNNVIADNGFGIQAVGGAALLTGLGNTMFNNTTPGAPTGTVSPI